MQHAYHRPAGRPSSPRESALDGVLGLDGRGGHVVWVASGIAVLLHLLLPWLVRMTIVLMSLIGLLLAKLLPSPPAAPPMQAFDVELAEPAPPPPKEEPKEEPKDEPKPEPKELPKDLKAPEAPKEAPVAAAAQAGAVLTQETKPDEPVDLTNSFVTGTGSTYAGGTTMAAGTATAAVRAPTASPTGVVGGTGTAAPVAPAGPDRSRNAGLGGSKSWNDCPFPPEADVDNIDQAAVLVQVSVNPDGRPGQAKVLSDPGHGFGRAARACAMQRTYQTALDRDGKPVAGVFTANVTFAR
ncbi:MAG: energy transducer TonB [Polyangiaceae bacterium]